LCLCLKSEHQNPKEQTINNNFASLALKNINIRNETDLLQLVLVDFTIINKECSEY
jgi:hypothetical protein